MVTDHPAAAAAQETTAAGAAAGAQIGAQIGAETGAETAQDQRQATARRGQGR